MDVRVGLWRKLSAKELMLLNCGVGEDSWESLGLRGDPTSPSWRRSVLGVHWRDWCWSRNSNTWATSCEKLTHWKRPWCWEGLGAGGEGDDRGWDGWMASPTPWTWVWVNSRSWWWTGRPGVLRFMGSQRVRHDRDWTELKHSLDLKLDSSLQVSQLFRIWIVCLSLIHVRLLVTPWTVTLQVPLSVGFSRQEYWSGLPRPPPGDLPNLGMEPRSPALQADSLPSEPPESQFGLSLLLFSFILKCSI